DERSGQWRQSALELAGRGQLDRRWMEPVQHHARRALAAGVARERRQRAAVQVLRTERAVEHASEAGLEATQPEFAVWVVALGVRGVGHVDREVVRAPQRAVASP